MPQQRRFVYRSVFRLVTWLPVGVLVTLLGVLLIVGGDWEGSWFLAMGVFLIGFCLWPRVVATSDGIEIRNLREVSIAWRDVATVRLGSQLPHLGRAWRFMNSVADAQHPRRIGTPGIPGLLVSTKNHSRVRAALAIQQDPFGVGKYADRVRGELDAGRAAWRRREDTLAAIDEFRQSTAA